jgi:hypothetical protein
MRTGSKDCFLFEGELMKWVAVGLVVAIGGYAIYTLFAGNSGLSLLTGAPGTNTSAGVDIPGVPAYSSVGTVASNLAGESTEAATAATQFEDAFGAGGNDVSSDETSVDFDD